MYYLEINGWFGDSSFFKSIISTNFNVIVDHMIGSPGYGKYVVNGVNSCDKWYLMGKCVWLVHQRLMIVNRRWILIQ